MIIIFDGIFGEVYWKQLSLEKENSNNWKKNGNNEFVFTNYCDKINQPEIFLIK